MTTRRHFIGATAATLLGGVIPWRIALARPGARDHYKFIFVHCSGGWDVLTSFVPNHSNPAIERESGSSQETVNNFTFMHHDSRESVMEFFTNSGSETLLINGVQVPSIAHDSCNKLIFTGSTSNSASDWGAALASARSDLLLPHTIVDGFGNQGLLSGVSTRIGTNGKMEPLLDGTFATQREPADNNLVDRTTRSHGSAVESILDAHLQARGSAAQGTFARPMGQDLAGIWTDSVNSASVLKGTLDTVNWDVGGSLDEQLGFALQALGGGLSRCVTVKFNGGQDTWDSHDDNDATQSANFESLFQSLNLLRTGLQTTQGEVEATLAEETVVVVLSEMARTPTYNVDLGRDHWSYTSVLMFGPGIKGGRVVGEYDYSFYGRPMDPVEGEVSDSGIDMHSATIGATLMELVGFDYEEFVPGYPSIPGFVIL